MGWFTKFATRLALLAALVIIIAAAAGCARDKAPDSQPPARESADTPAAGDSGSEAGERPAKQPEKSGNAEPGSAEAEKDDVPSMIVTQEGVTINWKEGGELRMSAKARELEADEVSRTGTLVDFTADLYENGKLTASLSAPRAVADTVKREVTATGGVTVKSVERKTTVRADWMRWYATKEKIIGTGRVRIESTMGTISAAAFVADTSMRTLSVRDSTKGLEL